VPNVIVDITVSLDGFVTGEHADEQQELGDPPEPTREHAAGCGDTEILEHATAASGAVVRGRRFSEAYLIGVRHHASAHRTTRQNDDVTALEFPGFVDTGFQAAEWLFGVHVLYSGAGVR